MGDLVRITEQSLVQRLSPAEAYTIIRQRLGWLAPRWGLRAADVGRLASQTRTSTYGPGEIILPKGVRGDCLGLVVQGQVAVHVGDRASARVVVVLMPGSTFGEMMLAEGLPSSTTLQALTRCEVRFLRRTDIRPLAMERKAEHQTAQRWQLARSALIALAVLSWAMVLIRQPATRQVLAMIPMGLGQWCSEREYDACTQRAWQISANLAPDDPIPLLALGTIYFDSGDIAAAERAFLAAGSLADELAEVHNNLGLIYARQSEHKRAIDEFSTALELEPGAAAIEHNLALSLQALGHYDEAMAHYETALALGGPQTETLVNMAIALYEMDDPAGAVETAERALKYDDALAAAHTVLGAVKLDAQQPEQALPHLQRAVALDWDYGEAQFYLGMAYKALGQVDQAILSLEQSLARAEDELTRVRIRRYLTELYEVQRENPAP
ncbi:MAG: tetratricopeptide repeat protein [Anaerolineae bacterium]|nr:tetratricopeptide repeat protein [Anaerolineae bacterium]